MRLRVIVFCLGGLTAAACLIAFAPELRAQDAGAATPACADKGIFPEYDTRPELRVLCPSAGVQVVRDTDGDGIDDVLDVARGGRKAALNADPYKSAYVTLPYPGGDVPRTMGVCTDVVVRAMRNAGIDLQKLVHEDIVQRRNAYPWVDRPDSSIDHRRVRNMIPLFELRFEARSVQPLPTDTDSEGYADWRAGDIVFLDTFPTRAGIEHVGVVSDQSTSQRRPLIINNWTDGYFTQDMDLLSFVTPVKRFRPLPRRAQSR
jgi:uncharacterized protein YijF (DUF1287 family)